MSEVYIIGAYSSKFGKLTRETVKTLTADAWRGVLEDAGFDDGLQIESCWFGNCGMWTEGQGSVRGQVCMTPILEAGQAASRLPIINVEGGCATGSLALFGAWRDIASGVADISIALGVEKTFFPGEPEKTSALFNGGIDQYDKERWELYYADAGRACGKEFKPSHDRTIFMDTYAMQACYHMKTYGTTQTQIAFGAAKNHTIAALNPNAQYQFKMSVQQVLADRDVSYPLTRSMCAPIGDGAAAAVVVSEKALKGLPAHVRERAVRIAGTAITSGKYRSLTEPGLSRYAAEKAYRVAGVNPQDINVAEVHDATSFCEIYQCEMLGFCDEGRGGPFVESGETSIGGRIPVNTSGGLVSKGHPVGATGLSMISELCVQLRGEAGQRQVQGAKLALAENGGGVMGFDEACCAVTILSR